ncbi:MAG: cyclic nucleotide-binding domain-containing protein [Archangium sp.]|nr:cyclic nucleotide-binding domain-containing protein [Archangium sp.]MDP3155507.1 cyclic nucleotide-binding domain-containing protein [Archangium sp.]MDP3573839.1 cyclic nucleotide-binding domain-containing protein [Archangium sp.]
MPTEGVRSWTSRLAPAAAFQFCFIASVAMLKPASNALTLSRFNSSALPWLYIAAAVIAGGLALAGSEGKRRRNPGYLVLAGAMTSAGLAAGVWFELPQVALVAYLFSEAFATQVSLAFWGSMGDAFDAREARKAFSWINGIGMSGAIAGGFFAQMLARTAGALTLMVAGALFLFAAGIAWRFHRVELEAPSRRTTAGPRAGWREVLLAPYTQLLGVLVLGLSLLQQLTDYLFRARVADKLLEADMAELFAAHQLWTGVFCVAFQFFLAELLLRKLGILKYAAVVPATLAALTIGAWAIPSVWSAFALKVFEAASSWSLMPVAIQLMYAPLPDHARDGARRTIDGLVRKGGMVVAGLSILALANVVGLGGVFALSLLVCGGVGWALFKIRPRYVEAVHARVAGMEAGGAFEGEERMLSQELLSASPEHALRAADLLERTELISEVHVRTLLSHRQERVQERGVILADSLKLTALAKPLEAIIVTGSRRPRDGAIWALARLAPERARQVLPPLLAQQDIGVLTAAIGGLLILPGPEDERARAMLEGLLGRGIDAPPAERREVARLLGRLGKPESAISRALVGYLEDSDLSVRRVAIEATGEGKYVGLAPRLLRFLSWRDDRRVAREALATLGDAVVPLLAAALDDRSRARSLRLQLPRVLRLIGTQAALDALLFSNAIDDPSLHYRVGIALAQLHDEHPEFEIDEERQLEALTRRKEGSLKLIEPFRDCRAALGEDALLTRVLADRLDQSMELSFWLLGLRRDARGLRRAHTLLLGSDTRRRAWAMELVDNVISPEERELVAHHVDAHHRSLPFGAAARFHGHLQMLCASDDFILKACARAVGRSTGHWTSPHREDDMNEITVKRLFALEGVEIFARSDVDDVAAVAAVAREQTFRKGAQVYSEGDPGDALYVIVEGAMEARRDGEVVLRMKAKESFGETSLFDGAPRINEVVATMDSKALVIDRRDFLDLLADRPELLAGMFRVLSRQLKTMVVEVANRRGTGDYPAIGGPPLPDGQG